MVHQKCKKLVPDLIAKLMVLFGFQIQIDMFASIWQISTSIYDGFILLIIFPNYFTDSKRTKYLILYL